MDNKEMTEKILNKKFKKSIFSGYDTVDVDNFFDKVIDYLKNNDKMVELYKKEFNSAKSKETELETKVSTLQAQNQKLITEIQLLHEEGYGSNVLIKQRNLNNQKK